MGALGSAFQFDFRQASSALRTRHASVVVELFNTWVARTTLPARFTKIFMTIVSSPAPIGQSWLGVALCPNVRGCPSIEYPWPPGPGLWFPSVPFGLPLLPSPWVSPSLLFPVPVCLFFMIFNRSFRSLLGWGSGF